MTPLERIVLEELYDVVAFIDRVLDADEVDDAEKIVYIERAIETLRGEVH